MLVLGKHADDKGTQLEALTVRLLSARGYQNVCTNTIGAGGEEIDVQGDYDVPSVTAQKRVRLICECKAHKAAVNLPDWLKFCGKLFVAHNTSARDTHGCFIALSGVNGPVRGNYEELKAHDARIELVTGDDLFALVRQIHPIVDLRAVLERANNLTDRTIVGSDIVYYENQVYWFVLFEHDTYTVLKADGKDLTDDDANVLRPMVEATLPVATYINLQDEAQAKERARAADTAVIARLMVLGGKASVKAIIDGSPQQSDDLNAAVCRMADAGVVTRCDDGDLQLPEDDYKKIAAVYCLLHTGPCPIPPLGCPWYDRHINGPLLDEIRRIQGGMPLRSEVIDKVLDVLRFSPTALRIALQPIDVIVNGRAQLGAVPLPTIDQAHEDYLLKALFDSLQRDFTYPGLSDFFYVKRGVRELELRGSYILKSQTDIRLQHDYRQRHLHGFISGAGDRPVLMLALQNSPEPWEDPLAEKPSGTLPKGASDTGENAAGIPAP